MILYFVELEQFEFRGCFSCVGGMRPGLCFKTFLDKGMIFQLHRFGLPLQCMYGVKAAKKQIFLASIANANCSDTASVAF